MATPEKKAPDAHTSALDGIGNKVLSERDADVTLAFVKEFGDIVDPLSPKKGGSIGVEAVSPYYGSVDDYEFDIDKATLSYASFLGIFASTNLNDGEYNNLNTMFYTGYVLAQAPGHYLMQRFSLGKFVSVTVFLWSIIVFLHCVAYNYGGLMALRFFLGAVEANLVPAMEITMGMFFKPAEQGFLQPIFWISCMGSPIPAGFIAYGLLFRQSAVRPGSSL